MIHYFVLNTVLWVTVSIQRERKEERKRKADSDNDWFSVGAILHPRGHLQCLQTFLVFLSWGGKGECYWHLIVKARDTAEHLTMGRTAPHNKE